MDKNRDPRDGSLRRLLEAHVVYEQMSAAKKVFLHLLAIVGLLVWVGAMWPSLFSSQLLDSVLAVWISLLFFAVVATVEEWLWQRKVARYREQQSKENEPAG